jgi:DNA-binding SARP family transcriptional activator
MNFRLLGPLEADLDGRTLSLGGSRARALLALLLLHRNEVLALDRIIDELWPGQPPKTAEQVVRVYVSQLRKSLEPGRSENSPQVLVTRGSGYLLSVGPEELDLDRFDSLRADGRRLLATGDFAQAVEAFDQALSLWSGPPLQEFEYETFAQPEIARLEELRLATFEDRFDAQLAVGQDSELVADIEQLVAANPLRERLRAQLMLALYRSGRHANALEAYQRGRRALLELGLEPSETLRQLETRILQQDPALDRPGISPRSPESFPDPLRSSRRTSVRAIAVTLLGIAVIAGVLVAATVGHGRRSAARPRVALVVNELRSGLDETGHRPDRRPERRGGGGWHSYDDSVRRLPEDTLPEDGRRRRANVRPRGRRSVSVVGAVVAGYEALPRHAVLRARFRPRSPCVVRWAAKRHGSQLR